MAGRSDLRQFAPMESGGGSSVDVLDVRLMCGSDFP
jgi:hypothetical protein